MLWVDKRISMSDIEINEEPRSKLTGYLAVNLFHTQRM